ncbi:MAG: methyltransferase [Proteobacteria bacterium]|nr:methyltransferase [Pseudomonadota bacterium]MBI3497892.1 methyltransferase [Pseudomonadota bacterium]
MPEAESEDRLLGGRVRLTQPKAGYRAAIDPVLLAAAVEAEPGESVLDLGIGAGAAALCLAARVPGLRIVGLEVQSELARLARLNAALNGIDDLTVFDGSLRDPPPALAGQRFDHVIANPPYLEAERASEGPSPGKRAATVEGASLEEWLAFALALAAPKASLTVIHRADRLADLLAGLERGAGAIAVMPLWPKAGRPAKRVIVSARRGSRAALRLLPGIVLHQADGRFTAAAEAILRDAHPLSLA